MPVKPKVVIDTNVFVSAVLGGRVCRAIMSALARDEFALVVSEPILKEIRDILFDRELGPLDPSYIEELFRTIGMKAVVVKPTRSLTICRDPDDNMMLEAAITAKANCIISGDKDLLALNPFEGIPIVTPREFLQKLK